MDTKYLSSLKTRIESLEFSHHVGILRIIYNNKVKISENKNGIFINMYFLSESVINEIVKYIEYINEQKDSLNTVEYQKEEFKKSFFDENEDKDNSIINNNTII